jgi:hypothetical protein
MSDLTAEQIKAAKREQMMQNLERGRKVRADNLKMARQRNLKKTIESNETERTEDTLEDNKSKEKESKPKNKTPPRDKSKFVCICGKSLASKYSLKQHEGICKIYQEQTTKLEEPEEKPKIEVVEKKDDEEADKPDDDEVEIHVIKRKKPKKKKVVYVEEEESEEEPQNEVIEAPPPPKLKREKPHIPKNTFVPSAHSKKTHLPPKHFEQEERYTIAQFKTIVEKENRMRQEKAIQDKRLNEDKRFKSIIENMRMGGI